MSASILRCRTLIFVLSAAVVAGCGSGGGDNAVDLIGPRFEPNSPHLFLEFIQAEVDAAEDVARCMREQGFEYFGPTYEQELERLPRMVDAFDDPALFAREFGYGITNPDFADPRPGDVMRPIDLDYETALYGRPVHEMAEDGLEPAGCWATSSIHELGGVVERFMDERDEITAKVDNDTAVEALRADWSRCMAEQGYAYFSPTEAIDSFRDKFSGVIGSFGPGNPMSRETFEELLEEEISTATTDLVACDGAELRSERARAAGRIGGWSQETLDALRESDGE